MLTNRAASSFVLLYNLVMKESHTSATKPNVAPKYCQVVYFFSIYILRDINFSWLKICISVMLKKVAKKVTDEERSANLFPFFARLVCLFRLYLKLFVVVIIISVNMAFQCSYKFCSY